MQTDESPPAKPLEISRQRLWIYRLICIFFTPPLVLALFEIVLIAIGYGYVPRFTIQCERDGKACYRQNFQFTDPYFSQDLVGIAAPFTIPAEKPPNTYRIFILGSSAAEGWPEPRFSFSRILEAMLMDQFPGANIEVHNAAVGATNSHVTLEVARDLARHEPDLFVIYLGNNEVIGPYGPSGMYVPYQSSLMRIRWNSLIHRTRTGQLFRSLKGKISGSARKSRDDWQGMKAFIGQEIGPSDPRIETVYRYFHRNMTDMIRIARKSGAQVALCTVGSNIRDLAPFASVPDPNSDERMRAIYEEGLADEEIGENAQAMVSYEAALAKNQDCAELHFRLARLYLESEAREKAAEHFVRARDLDALRFRADSGLNDIIRVLADRHKDQGVFLVDAVEAFKANSRYGIPGKELFLEHVHMRFRGNYVLAAAVFKNMGPHLPDWLFAFRAADRPILLSFGDAMRRLSYTGFNHREVLNRIVKMVDRPPFIHVSNHQELRAELEAEFARTAPFAKPKGLYRAAALHRAALEARPTDKWIHLSLAKVLLRLGELDDARTHAMQGVEQMPEFEPAQAILRRIDEAIAKQGEDALID